ncbi:hypothetical protein BASA60_000107 [Batrachochytrium salamandrivorans]|nr:hypothetical protein BASA60_000107 [Batrachochytrium salamandrivorans]
MKLISFAVVSLLAITVSAQPPLRPSTSQDTHDTQEPMDLSTHGRHQSQGAAAQNIPQSQSAQEHMDDSSQDSHQSQGAAAQDMLQFLDAATQDIQRYMNAAAQNRHQSQDAAAQNIPQYQSPQELLGVSVRDMLQFINRFTQISQQPMGVAAPDMQQSDQDKVRIELTRLDVSYRKQYLVVSKIDNEIKTGEQRLMEVKRMMIWIIVQLQGASLDSNEELQLRKLYADLHMVSGELAAQYKEQQPRYETARRNLDDMHTEIQLLKGNQALLADHNANNDAQMVLSPNSCYNMVILERQYEKIFRDIESSLEEQKNINAAESTHGNALETQKEAIRNRIQMLQSYSEVAGRILFKHRHSMSMTQWTSGFLQLMHAEFPNITN